MLTLEEDVIEPDYEEYLLLAKTYQINGWTIVVYEEAKKDEQIYN